MLTSPPTSKDENPDQVFFFGENMKIKNWAKFQHFKDRRPPWVKLYRDILDDIEWFELDPQLAKTLVMFWLIASEDDGGRLPDAKKLAFRLRQTEKQINAAFIGLSHWLECDDISSISEKYQSDPLETETETEIETETEKKHRATRLPATWEPSESMIEHCKLKRPDLNWHEVAEAFRDYWVSAPKGTKLDWEATWRTWVRNQRAVPANKKLNLVNANQAAAMAWLESSNNEIHNIG